MIIEQEEALREHLGHALTPLAEADPDILTNYVIALLKSNDKPRGELIAYCNEQLVDFLKEDTESFVSRLFDVVESKSYITVLPKGQGPSDKPDSERNDAEKTSSSLPFTNESTDTSMGATDQGGNVATEDRDPMQADDRDGFAVKEHSEGISGALSAGYNNRRRGRDQEVDDENEDEDYGNNRTHRLTPVPPDADADLGNQRIQGQGDTRDWNRDRNNNNNSNRRVPDRMGGAPISVAIGNRTGSFHPNNPARGGMSSSPPSFRNNKKPRREQEFANRSEVVYVVSGPTQPQGNMPGPPPPPPPPPPMQTNQLNSGPVHVPPPGMLRALPPRMGGGSLLGHPPPPPFQPFDRRHGQFQMNNSAPNHMSSQMPMPMFNQPPPPPPPPPDSIMYDRDAASGQRPGPDREMQQNKGHPMQRNRMRGMMRDDGPESPPPHPPPGRDDYGRQGSVNGFMRGPGPGPGTGTGPGPGPRNNGNQQQPPPQWFNSRGPLQQPQPPPPPPPLLPPQQQLMEPPLSMQRCRDYDERGFCVRGERCPYQHGSDRIVFNDVEKLRSFAPSLAHNAQIIDQSRPFPPPHQQSDQSGQKSLAAGDMRDTSLRKRPSPQPSPTPQPPSNSRAPPSSMSLAFGAGEYDPDDYNTLGIMPMPLSSSQPDAVRIQQQLGRSSSPNGMDISSRRHNVSEEERQEGMGQPEDEGAYGRGGGGGGGWRRGRGGRMPTSSDVVRGPRLTHPHDGTKPRMGSLPSHTTLSLAKVPPEYLNVESLMAHFRKYGTVINILIIPNTDKALVKFSNNYEARAAVRSPDAVCGNRFIRIYWSEPEEMAEGEAAQAAELAVRQQQQEQQRHQQQQQQQQLHSQPRLAVTRSVSLPPSSFAPPTTPTATGSTSTPSQAAAATPAVSRPSKSDLISKQIKEQLELLSKIGSMKNVSAQQKAALLSSAQKSLSVLQEELTKESRLAAASMSSWQTDGPYTPFLNPAPAPAPAATPSAAPQPHTPSTPQSSAAASASNSLPVKSTALEALRLKLAILEKQASKMNSKAAQPKPVLSTQSIEAPTTNSTEPSGPDPAVDAHQSIT